MLILLQDSLVAQTVKNLTAMLKTQVRSPGLGKSPGKGNGNPLQDSCLENSMDREAWRATVHGVAESDTTEQLTHNVSSVQSLSHVWLLATPWTAARQAFLSITNSRSLRRLEQQDSVWSESRTTERLQGNT